MFLDIGMNCMYMYVYILYMGMITSKHKVYRIHVYHLITAGLYGQNIQGGPRNTHFERATGSWKLT